MIEFDAVRCIQLAYFATRLEERVTLRTRIEKQLVLAGDHRNFRRASVTLEEQRLRIHGSVLTEARGR